VGIVVIRRMEMLAAPFFNEGLKRIEVWCGSRKVGNLPPRSDEISDGMPIRDSA
jgi:hypothetical protein